MTETGGKVGRHTFTDDDKEDEAARPVITFDYERYAHFLDTADLTEDQKREFLQSLWNIIVQFVSMGFGVHPVQQAQNTCGKLTENSLKPPLAGPDQVLLDCEFLTDNFELATESEKDSAAEGVKQ